VGRGKYKPKKEKLTITGTLSGSRDHLLNL